MKKLRAGWSRGMLAVICCIIFLSSSLLSNNIKIKVHRSIILPFALYGCETRSHWGGNTVRGCWRVGRWGYLGLGRGNRGVEKTTEGRVLWSVLDRYLGGDQIRKNEMAVHVARMGEMRGVYMVLMGRPEGIRPVWRLGRTWRNNIEMDLQEVGWREWTGLIWFMTGTGGERLWIGNEPSGSIKCVDFLEWLRTC